MAKVVKNTLGYLGVDFQYRLVNAFIERPKFFKDLYTIIDQNMFTEAYLKTIVGVMKEYYQKHDVTASYDMILIKLRDKAYSTDDLQYYEETIGKLRDISTEGIDEVEDMAEKFFKQQNWVRVANTIMRIAGDGDMGKYDECQSLIEQANAIGRHTEETTSPLDNIEEDLTKENIITIPTGVKKLDDTLGGGLDKGKIGLIMGSTSFGKTSMTTGISAYAASYKCEANNYKGYKVLQIVFEDAPRDIHRKYFSRLTQIETCKINESEQSVNEVRKRLKNHPDFDLIKNNIRIMQLDTGEYSATDIIRIIKKKINEGFKPDMVVVDYLECVNHEKGSGNMQKWEQETKTMRKFENGAKELDIALWLPSQGNRASVSSELVTMDQGSGAFTKQQISQVVISITRSVDDIKNQKATLSILKNRSGSAGIVLNGIEFNNGTCTIKSDDVIDFDSPHDYNEYAADKKEAERLKDFVF